MNSNLLIIDLFCGAGGTSTGAAQAGAKVVACVNHDENAILSHSANHPEVQHFIEDIRTLDIHKIKAVLDAERSNNADAKVMLWASLECTNFSIAKGGQSRDGDSRSLAEVLYSHLDANGEYAFGDSYIQQLDPDFIYIENVKEFLTYGPLIQKMKDGQLMFDKKNKPVMIPDPKHKGEYFNQWANTIDTLGYHHQYKLMNAKDYGACQSRQRLFVCFAKHGLEINFPTPTHGKPGTGLLAYRPVKEVLELQQEGISIFNRKGNTEIPKRQLKELCEKTLERIYAGLVKFVANGDVSFLSKYYSGEPDNKNESMHAPSGTVRTKDSHAIVNSIFLSKYFSGDAEHKNISAEGVAGTITAIDHHSIVKCVFVHKYMGNNEHTGINNGKSIDEPSLTITTGGRIGLVEAFQIKYHGTGENIHPINEPCTPVTTKDRIGLVKIEYMMEQYGASSVKSINSPNGTLTTHAKQNIVQCFLMSTHFNNVGQTIDEAAPTMTAARKQHYIIEPSWFNTSPRSIEQPAGTVIAATYKAPNCLVSVSMDEQNMLGIAVFENDTPAMVKIKLFMAAYGIIDIKMRMLLLLEQQRIQGFPDNYILMGTLTQRKKYVGNAVEVHQGKACIAAVMESLVEVGVAV
jgi:DNA (cytosine-5)-methyltransferase 1